jgi:DHA1 family bicyclomycin/chloramphenicol resistance-like MFS transporter
MHTPRPATPRAQPPGFGEFVVLVAAMMSTQALAVDAMLPALPTIVRELGVRNANHGQWVVTAYIAGVGLGQLFWGLISDRFGRRPVLLCGLALYVLASVSCALTGNFIALLGWRMTHGLAAASVVVSRSVIRDLYSGRTMARVMSLTFMVFLIVPILAPSLGQLILLLAPWRDIFLVFGVYGATIALWAFLRLPETLHPEFRLTLTVPHILGAVRLVLGERASLCYTLAVTIMFGSLLSYVGMVQQIFADVFHRASWMPAVFALCAISMGAAAYTNSRIVERLGMRAVSHTALLLFIGVTAVHASIAAFGLERLWSFVLLQSATMACFALTASNFGAMAMEPVGAVAGIGASLQGFITTLGGALLGAVIGRQFNGSTLPLAAGALCSGLLSLFFVLLAERGRLFRPHHPVALSPGTL